MWRNYLITALFAFQYISKIEIVFSNFLCYNRGKSVRGVEKMSNARFFFLYRYLLKSTCEDEARHGRALKGLLDRYFGK